MAYEIKYRSEDEMKDSGIEWLGKIPKEWEVKLIKYLITSNDGGVWGDEPTGVSGIPVLRSTEITHDGEWELGNLAYRKINKIDALKYKLLKDDLLITKSSGSSKHIGKTGLVTYEIETMNAVYSNFMQRIRLQSNCDIKLFHYYFNNPIIKEQVNFLGTTTTGLMNVNAQTINEISVVLGDIFEQQKIANFLDIKTAEFDTIISKKEQLIEKLEAAKKSLISEVVTGKVKIVDGELVDRKPEEMKDSGVEWLGMIPKDWETTKLSYRIEVKDGTHDTPKYVDESDESYPLITSKDFKDGEIDFRDCKYISKYDHDKIISRSNVSKGDILMSMIGGNIGNLVIVNTDIEFSIKNVALFKTENNFLDRKFLYYILKIKILDVQIDIQARGGAQDFLSLSNLRNLIYFVIKESEQELIIQYLDNASNKMESIITKTQQQITKLKEAKQSLISEAVTGKIDLRDWEIIETGGR